MAGVSKKVNTYDDKWSKVSVALPTLPEEVLPRPVWTCSTDCAHSCGEQGNPVHVMRASGMAGLFFSIQMSAMPGALAAEEEVHLLQG